MSKAVASSFAATALAGWGGGSGGQGWLGPGGGGTGGGCGTQGAEAQRCQGLTPHPGPRKRERGGQKERRNVENGRKMWKMGEEKVEKWAEISFRGCLGKFPTFLSV